MKPFIFSTEFTIDEIYYPKLASKILPDWYKEMQSYVFNEKKPGGDGNNTGTIKKCMPVFDSITAGYILVLPADVYVSQKDNQPFYEWSNHGLIQFHPVEQAPAHPNSKGFAYPKFMNPWAIKTPIGYSTLFVQPFHRESPFTILPGIVDTDSYSSTVNLPFVLNDSNFEGLIPAGTPIAQIIPIKRDNWKLQLGETQQKKVRSLLHSKFFDGYKTFFWHKKEYK
jgi:hypothetical protein